MTLKPVYIQPQGDDAGRKLLSEAETRYPFLKQHDLAVSVNKGSNKGYAETFPAGEEGSPAWPRPVVLPIRRPGIEVYKPEAFGVHDIAGEGLHIDPIANETRARLYNSLTDKQIAALKQNSRDYSDWPNQSEAERLRNMTDAAIRGHTIGQWPQHVNEAIGYDVNQKKMLDNLKTYMTTGTHPEPFTEPRIKKAPWELE